MKRTFLVALLALLGVAAVSADDRADDRRPSVQDRVSHLKKELSLTDEQTEKITSLFTDFDKKMKAAGSVTKDKMRAAKDSLDLKVESLLTQDQKTLYQKHKAHSRHKHPGKQKESTKN